MSSPSLLDHSAWFEEKEEQESGCSSPLSDTNIDTSTSSSSPPSHIDLVLEHWSFEDPWNQHSDGTTFLPPIPDLTSGHSDSWSNAIAEAFSDLSHPASFVRSMCYNPRTKRRFLWISGLITIFYSPTLVSSILLLFTITLLSALLPDFSARRLRQRMWDLFGPPHQRTRTARIIARESICDILLDTQLDPSTTAYLVKDTCRTARLAGVPTQVLLSYTISQGDLDSKITPLCLEVSRVNLGKRGGMEFFLWLINNMDPALVAGEVKKGCTLRQDRMGKRAWEILKDFIPHVDRGVRI